MPCVEGEDSITANTTLLGLHWICFGNQFFLQSTERNESHATFIILRADLFLKGEGLRKFVSVMLLSLYYNVFSLSP